MPLNIDWQQILLHVFNFIILAAGLSFLLFKPVRKFMRAREEKYKSAAEKHERTKSEIAELEAERDRKIAGMDAELEEHRKSVLEQTENRNKRIIAEAEQKAQEILEGGRRKAEEEKAAYFAGAEEDIRDMVLKSAEKLLALNSSPESDKALYDCYLKSADKDVTLSGISAEAKATLAERLAAMAVDDGGKRRADARADIAEILGDAARAAIERGNSPEKDSALYDAFLNSVNEGGNNDRT